MEKELIWVTKELAEQYKKLDNESYQEELVKRIIINKKIDIEEDLSSLDEAVLRFKAACIMHKNALKEAYNSQSEQITKMWEDLGDIDTQLKKQTQELLKIIQPIKKELGDISTLVKSLRDSVSDVKIYDIEKMTRLAELISGLDNRGKEIIHALTKKE